APGVRFSTALLRTIPIAIDGRQVERIGAGRLAPGAAFLAAGDSGRRFVPDYFVALAMNLASAAICSALKLSSKEGMGPIPFLTTSTTWLSLGFSSSRSGPISPVASAAFNAWQTAQGGFASVVKTRLPRSSLHAGAEAPANKS